jgi:hypothetical protein
MIQITDCSVSLFREKTTCRSKKLSYSNQKTGLLFPAYFLRYINMKLKPARDILFSVYLSKAHGDILILTKATKAVKGD